MGSGRGRRKRSAEADGGEPPNYGEGGPPGGGGDHPQGAEQRNGQFQFEDTANNNNHEHVSIKAEMGHAAAGAGERITPDNRTAAAPPTAGLFFRHPMVRVGLVNFSQGVIFQG